MLLMSPADAAIAIGVKCGGSSPSADDPQLLFILGFLTSRIENSLETDSLTRRENVDRFELRDMPLSIPTDCERSITLRTTSAFMVAGSISISDSNGEEVPASDIIDIDHQYGMVKLRNWLRGGYYVSYLAGFEPTEEPADPPIGYDPEQRILVGVPDWIKSIVVAVLVLWFRTSYKAVTSIKGVGYGASQDALIREIATRVYGRWLRERHAVIFGARR